MKEEVINNKFIENLRVSMEIDEYEYMKLCKLLILISEDWRDKQYIDKEIVSYLYAMPLMVRNEFLSLKEVSPNSEICERLEDIWVELDELVSNCFI